MFANIKLLLVVYGGGPVSLNISSPFDTWLAFSWVKPLGVATVNYSILDRVSGQPGWNEGVGCYKTESNELRPFVPFKRWCVLPMGSSAHRTLLSCLTSSCQISERVSTYLVVQILGATFVQFLISLNPIVYCISRVIINS